MYFSKFFFLLIFSMCRDFFDKLYLYSHHCKQKNNFPREKKRATTEKRSNSNDCKRYLNISYSSNYKKKKKIMQFEIQKKNAIRNTKIKLI